MTITFIAVVLIIALAINKALDKKQPLIAILMLAGAFNANAQCNYPDPFFLMGGGHQIQAATPGQIEEMVIGGEHVFQIYGHRVMLPSLRTQTGHWIYFWRISTTGGNTFNIIGGESTCDSTIRFNQLLPQGTIISCQVFFVDVSQKFKVYSYDIARVTVGQNTVIHKPAPIKYESHSKIIFKH